MSAILRECRVLGGSYRVRMRSEILRPSYRNAYAEGSFSPYYTRREPDWGFRTALLSRAPRRHVR